MPQALATPLHGNPVNHFQWKDEMAGVGLPVISVAVCVPA